ncbi:MAG: putative metalloprotease CJM1_0395 family protein, partial [Psychromonas sp.]
KTPHSDSRKESAFSEAELDVIRALKSRDVEISAHEQAHTSVGGRHASSPVYRYKTGPDGVKYAISGEVAIDTSKIPGDPQATLQKAQQIKAAALAPVDPSAQDIQVVAKAEQMAAQARSEIVEANSHNNEDGHSGTSVTAETKIPEHFTETAHLSHVNNLDSHTEKLMSERNVHINRFYRNSARVTPLSSFNVQV